MATVLALALVGVGCASAPALAAGTYEVESVSASLSTPQAGAHADLTTFFSLTQEAGEPFGLTRDIAVDLPPGIIGNPQGIPRCSTLQLGESPEESQCPISSQVGVAELTLGGVNSGSFIEPIYNMVPPGGDVVARLGFFAAPFPVILNVRVDPIDYALVATVEGAAAAASLISSATTLWGVPAAKVHDPYRITPEEALIGSGPPGGREAGLPEAPFLTNPTSCGSPGALSVTATSYQFPAAPSTKSALFPQIVGCGKVTFKPTFTLTATNPEAAAPTGVDAELRMAQDETANGRGTSTLRSAVVSLPPGLTINPAAGDGLAACSADQVGFERPESAHCPAAAKIGSAELDVPALEHVLHGAVYQRTPEPGHLFRFWLVADELGVHLKLPAEIEANPVTGQLTTVFNGIPALGGNPQVPVSDLELHIFGGPRAPLSTPSACGTYQSHYSFTPWSGTPPVSGDTAMQVTTGCAKGGFSPTLSAGMLNPSAGKFSPFVMQLNRADGEDNPAILEVTLPDGLLAKLGGVPLCPEGAAAIAACPSSSQVGTAATAAGVGGAPLWIPQPGKDPTAIYLAGPYRGAPYSLVVKVPAQAGPFDLGTVVTRAAISVDPETTVASVASDPLPQILEGVPVAYRAIRVEINRPEFTLNPTDCNAKSITARVISPGGAVATPSTGYQATNCARLGYRPKLTLRLKGGTRRSQHPALHSTLTQPKGQANTTRAQITLPSSEFIDPVRLSNPCTRVQFNAGACPKSSVLGRAKAITPLLDTPLEGPVYFRSNGGARRVPDIVADLRGPIHVVLVGAIDSVVKGEISRIRTTFFAVPDAPVTKFTLNLFGGKRGVLVNSANLCAAERHVKLRLSGQNGRVRKSSPVLRPRCH